MNRRNAASTSALNQPDAGNSCFTPPAPVHHLPKGPSTTPRRMSTRFSQLISPIATLRRQISMSSQSIIHVRFTINHYQKLTLLLISFLFLSHTFLPFGDFQDLAAEARRESTQEIGTFSLPTTPAPRKKKCPELSIIGDDTLQDSLA